MILAIMSTKLVEMKKFLNFVCTSTRDCLTQKTHCSPCGTDIAILKRFFVVLSYDIKNRLDRHISCVPNDRKDRAFRYFKQKWAAKCQLVDNNGHFDFTVSISGNVTF